MHAGWFIPDSQPSAADACDTGLAQQRELCQRKYRLQHLGKFPAAIKRAEYKQIFHLLDWLCNHK